jgi:type II secretory pathway pseudopilin PulG
MEKRELKENRKGFVMNKYSAIRNLKSTFERGFTLIEIIILIVMAGIIIPAIIVPFATGIRGSQKPEMVTKAMYYAHQRMEDLMKYNYNNAALNVTVGFVAFTTGGEPDYTGQNEIVYVNDDLSTPVASPGVGYKRIIVRVTDPESSTYDVYAVVANFP